MNRGKTATAIVAIALIALLAQTLVYLSSPTGFTAMQRGQEKKVVKIGLLAPLTGSVASVGEDVRNAVLLAMEDLPEFDNVEIQLVVEDSQSKPAEGVTAFKKLVEVDQVSAVVGITSSGVAQAIGPIAEEKGMPTILAVASSYKPEKEDSYVFKFWPSNKERASFEARFIVEKLGAKDIALIYVNNAMGSGLKEQFEKEVEQLGAKIQVLEAFNPDETDFRTSLIKIKNADPEAVFIIAYSPEAVNILKQGKEMGIDSQFLATSTVISKSFLDSVGKVAEGLIVDLPITRSEATAEFEERFADRFNDSILHPGSYFAYDSVTILAGLLDKTQERKEIKNKLYELKTNGISGAIEFDDFGKNKEKKEFGALIIKNSQFVPFE